MNNVIFFVVHIWVPNSFLMLCQPLWHFTMRRDTILQSSQIKLAITALKFTRFRGKKKKHFAYHMPDFTIILIFAHICQADSLPFFFLFFPRNKRILFIHSGVKACRHSTCRNHAGLCWALNWKMLTASLQFWIAENEGS